MRRITLIILLISLGPATTVLAKQPSALERAWQALAAKDQAKNTPTAVATPDWIPPTPGQDPAAAALITPTASALSTDGPNPLAEISTPVPAATPSLWSFDRPTTPDPFALTATATAEEILLSWANTGTALSQFAGYLVQRALARPDAEWTSLHSVPQATTSFRDLSATAKTRYGYQVLAMDQDGNSMAASQVVTVQLASSSPPDTPKQLQVDNEDERVRLKWSVVNPTSHRVAGYCVFRSPADEEAWSCITDTLVTKEEYYDETGKTRQPYRYKVAAVDSKGQTSTATEAVSGVARARSRNGLILMSTAYRGMGREDRGFNADMQFTYYIGTFYGEQEKELSPLSVYLDPISVWLLSGDVKYAALSEKEFPISAALGGKGGIQLFLRQQSNTQSESFSFTEKSELAYLWGGYATLSRSIGDWGVHAGYMQGPWGDPLFYLSKYMNPEKTRHIIYLGMDFPIVRRMNAAMEILYPLDDDGLTEQQPLLVNLHVDRLFNFDVAFVHWNRGWAFLGYFNLRFTIFPGQ